jgi:hypothetical protein
LSGPFLCPNDNFICHLNTKAYIWLINSTQGAADYYQPTPKMTLKKHLNKLRRDPAIISALAGRPYRNLFPFGNDGTETKILPLVKKPADYFATPVISNSYLSNGGVPLDVKESTLRFGTLLHAAVYEPLVWIETPEFRAFTAGENAMLPGISTDNDKIVRKVCAMKANAEKCPVLGHFLRDPDTRFELDTFALLYGLVPVKVKLDAKLNRNGHDLKSTSCRTRAEFLSHFHEYGYWRQAVLYKTVHGLKDFFFTGVSKFPPHPTFLVDTGSFKADMKHAKGELEALILAHLESNPNYIAEALEHLAQFMTV